MKTYTALVQQIDKKDKPIMAESVRAENREEAYQTMAGHVKRFNDTLRPKESRRKLIGIFDASPALLFNTANKQDQQKFLRRFLMTKDEVVA